MYRPSARFIGTMGNTNKYCVSNWNKIVAKLSLQTRIPKLWPISVLKK